MVQGRITHRADCLQYICTCMVCYKHRVKLDEGMCIVCDRDNEIMKLEAENARYRSALERIENECSRHDTTAWSIASDALENI